ncbi:MAG: hypothetical protein LBB85_11125, partial [Dysgonamonadaceae bacterium]|nr:hypothetical protein [Dysgonamonadaceae bacterium]
PRCQRFVCLRNEICFTHNEIVLNCLYFEEFVFLNGVLQDLNGVLQNLNGVLQPLNGVILHIAAPCKA